ncbi:MAG: VOC family protein [bacterium]|nr:VOC family protein [bacterium]
MIAHITVPVKNYSRAKKLYEAALKPLGYKLKMDMAAWKAAGFMEGGHTSFWIAQKPRMVPGHVALLAKSKVAVQKFYSAACRNGAKDNGAPGFRPDYGPTYYAAFVLDHDGNNIEACYFGERAPSAKKKVASKKRVTSKAKKAKKKPRR